MPGNAAHPLLTALNKPWGALAPRGRKFTPRGQTLFAPDSSTLDFFYLARGVLLLMHADVDGNERTIFRLGPGMTQEDLAVLLGMHRATLVRAFHELKAAGRSSASPSGAWKSATWTC